MDVKGDDRETLLVWLDLELALASSSENFSPQKVTGRLNNYYGMIPKEKIKKK